MKVTRPTWYVHDTYQHGDFPLQGAVKLGGRCWAYPKGSECRFYHDPATKVRTAIIKLADGTLHWLTEAGEVTGLPVELAAELSRRFHAAT